jgi:hypothetical protein
VFAQSGAESEADPALGAATEAAEEAEAEAAVDEEVEADAEAVAATGDETAAAVEDVPERLGARNQPTNSSAGEIRFAFAAADAGGFSDTEMA